MSLCVVITASRFPLIMNIKGFQMSIVLQARYQSFLSEIAVFKATAEYEKEVRNRDPL